MVIHLIGFLYPGLAIDRPAKLSTPDADHHEPDSAESREPYYRPLPDRMNVFETPHARFVGINPETGATTQEWRTPDQAAAALRASRYQGTLVR